MFLTTSLVLAGWSRIRFSRRASSVFVFFLFHSYSLPCSSYSIPRRLASSSFFTASLFLLPSNLVLAELSRLRFSLRISSLQDRVVSVFDGESLLCSSSSFFTASLFLFLPMLFCADWSSLCCSQRAPSLQDIIVENC